MGREDRRRAVREKAETEEQREKDQMERIERNKKWREKKFGKEKLDDDEDQVLDEKEQRKVKNREWRERRESIKKGNPVAENKQDTGLYKGLTNMVLTELLCPFCHEEMSPPMEVYQCEDGHN